MKIITIIAMYAISQVTGGCGQEQTTTRGEPHVPGSIPSEVAPNPDLADEGFLLRWRAESLPAEVVYDPEFDPDQLAAIQEAVDDWADALQFDVITLVAGEVNKDGVESVFDSLDDRKNTAYIHPDWGRSEKKASVLAAAVLSYGSTGWINQGDIVFNFTNFNFANTGGSAKRRSANIYSVALHEIGHFLGAAHVSAQEDPDSIMRPAFMVGDDSPRIPLSNGDIQRIRSRYVFD